MFATFCTAIRYSFLICPFVTFFSLIEFCFALQDEALDDLKFQVFHKVVSSQDKEREELGQEICNIIYSKKEKKESEALISYLGEVAKKTSFIAGKDPTFENSYVTLVFCDQGIWPEHAAIIIEYLDKNKEIQYRFCDVALKRKTEKEAFEVRIKDSPFIIQNLLWDKYCNVENHGFVKYYKFMTFPVKSSKCIDTLKEIEQERGDYKEYNTLLNNCCHYAERNLKRLGIPLPSPGKCYNGHNLNLATYGSKMLLHETEGKVYIKTPEDLKDQCNEAGVSLFKKDKNNATSSISPTPFVVVFPYGIASLEIANERNRQNAQDAKETKQHGKFRTDRQLLLNVIVNDVLSEPMRWYTFGAERGNLLTQFCLGKALITGASDLLGQKKNIKINIEEGLKWLRLAAKNNHTPAQTYLGKILTEGEERVPRNNIESLQWLSSAAENNDPEAQFCFGKAIIEDTESVGETIIEGLQWLCSSVMKRYTDAFSYLQKIAKGGNATAQFMLAEMYYKGSGINKDEKEALRWFKRASRKGNESALLFLRKMARQGHTGAQIIVGKGYFKGHGVPKNEKEGLRWLRLSALQGCVKTLIDLFFNTIASDCSLSASIIEEVGDLNNSLAQYLCGTIYENGYGKVPQNDSLAVKWYKRALAVSSDSILDEKPNAKLALAKHYETGKGVEKNYDAAAAYYYAAAIDSYSLACSKLLSIYRKNVNAAFYLGRCYQLGYGVERNESRAISCYQYAARRGHSLSRFSLGQIYEEYATLSQNNVPMQNVVSPPWSLRHFVNGKLFVTAPLNQNNWNRNALNAYKAAARGKLIPAHFKLVTIYKNGQLGTPKNTKEWIKQLKYAKRLGSKDALLCLGYAYSEQEVNVEAFNYYSLAYKAGELEAGALMAAAYLDGKGVKRNIVKAIELAHLVAGQGSVMGQRLLELMHEQGYNTSNMIGWAEWYKKTSIQNNLGLNKKMLQSFDIEEWYQKAQKQQYENALKKLVSAIPSFDQSLNPSKSLTSQKLSTKVILPPVDFTHSLLNAFFEDKELKDIFITASKPKETVDLTTIQKIPFEGECKTQSGLFSEYLTCPTVGDGDCFFHAVFTEKGDEVQVIKQKAAKMRQTLCQEIQNGQHIEECRELLYEHYLFLYSDNNKHKNLPDEIKNTLRKKGKYTVIYNFMKKFSLITKSTYNPENRFSDNTIKSLITEDEIKKYMENLRVVGGIDTYIPVRPGIKCPAEILAELGKKRINVFMFNNIHKRLDLLKRMGIEGPVVNILIHGAHFVRLYNPAESEEHKFQCNKIIKNYKSYNAACTLL